MQWAFILYFSATRNCWFSRNIPWKIKESSRSRKFSTKPEVCHAFQATDELTNFFFDVATSIFQLSDWDKRLSYILKFSLLQMEQSRLNWNSQVERKSKYVQSYWKIKAASVTSTSTLSTGSDVQLVVMSHSVRLKFLDFRLFNIILYGIIWSYKLYGKYTVSKSMWFHLYPRICPMD